jgi:surface antigen
MRLAPIVMFAILPAFAAACGPGNKQGTGTIVGAAAGGATGAAIAGGNGSRAVAGAAVGAVVGRQMDQRDRQMAAAAEYQALEYGQPGAPTPWDNPASQNRGQIVPGKPYQQGTLYCRAYTHTIYISGQPTTARGTACRQPDGSWKTVS